MDAAKRVAGHVTGKNVKDAEKAVKFWGKYSKTNKPQMDAAKKHLAKEKTNRNVARGAVGAAGAAGAGAAIAKAKNKDD